MRQYLQNPHTDCKTQKVPDAESCVYLIAHVCDKSVWDNPIKVGVSSDPDKRLLSLQTANPFPLVLVVVIDPMPRQDAYDIERHFHNEMSENRLCGEWFHVPDPVDTLVRLASEIIGNDFEYEIAIRSRYLERLDRLK